MPTFALIFEDDVDVPIDEAVRARHVAHLRSLGERAVLGGPTFGEDQQVTGRVVVGEFADLEAARAFAAGEPLVQAGRVKRWRAESMVIVQKDGAFIPTGG